MPENEIGSRIEPLSKGMMTAVARQIESGLEIPSEIRERYSLTLEQLGSEPVIKAEAKTETPEITSQNLADAAEILGEEQKMALPEVETPITIDGEDKVVGGSDKVEETTGGKERGGHKRDEAKSPGRFDFDREMLDNDAIPEARDRLDAYKATRQKLMKERPEGWVEKLSLLREKMDKTEGAARTGRVDLEEAGRRFENLFSPLTASNVKQQRDAARRWLDTYNGKVGISDEMVGTVEAILNREVSLLPEEENEIRQYCLDSVFDRDASNAMSIYSSFFGPQGYLHTDMGKAPEEIDLFRERIKEISDELGLDNWISVRKVIGEWGNLKKVEEITTSTLREGLFVPEYTESFFAGIVDPETNKVVEVRKITLPDGREVDIQAEVSQAMKALREFFETTDYYAYVGSGMDIKSRLYGDLGINKYVGEVAFSLLLSHLMLTDCKKTSTDPFMSMVIGGRKRMDAYAIEEDKDPYIRMGVQSLMYRGIGIVDSSSKMLPGVKESLNNWIGESLPGKLIPTGLSGDGKEALESGNWLLWRVNSTYTKAERATALASMTEGATVEIANDTETRLVEMQSALKVLDALKEVVKTESDVSSLGKLKGSLFAHVKGVLKGAGWVSDSGVDPEFDYISNGTRNVTSDEWTTRAMLTATKAFLYTHSAVDYLNRKPWTKFVLAENARMILSQKVQSEADAYLGFDPEVRKVYRKSFVTFVDTLWSQVDQIFDVTQNRNRLSKLPKWYKSGGGISDETIKAAVDSQKSIEYDSWRKVKEDLGL